MQDPFVACPQTPVIQLGETGSTNAEALRIGATGDGGPLWVMADRQTAGRGRLGRQWFSVSGNLHASLLVTLWCEAEEITQVSLLAGNVLADAVNAVAAAASWQAASRPILKWPNDLLIANAKCAGVLVETTALPNGSYRGVLGFGVNIEAAPDIAGRPSTSLMAHGLHTTPSALRASLDEAARAAFKTLASPEGFAQLKQRWLSQSLPLGSPLTVTTGTEVCRGGFAGLDDDGALLLRESTGNLRRITFGDVSASGNEE
jgi:BirA family transcriptional regulator, biotin operon repressor / biotin---[acetyl-CoA-carboxylase] ligase